MELDSYATSADSAIKVLEDNGWVYNAEGGAYTSGIRYKKIPGDKINENDANLVNAIDFINQTKLENQPVEEVQKPQLSEADQRSQKERRVLKGVIWIVVVVTVALFCYIIWDVYQLLV